MRAVLRCRPVRPALLVLALLAAAPLGFAQGLVQDHGIRRPPPLQPQDDCTLWTGYIPGNDPTAEATVQLCTRDRTVAGVFLWSSLQAGWSRRRFEGAWDARGTVLSLRDTAMIERHPATGWTLCTADRYTLRPEGADRLVGDYTSAECHDQGTLTLVRQRAAQATQPTAPAPGPGETARAQTTPPRPRTGLRRRWSCGVGPTPCAACSPAGGVLVLAGVLGALGRRRSAR